MLFKKAHYVALAVVILATLILLSLPGQTATRLKLAAGSLFLPLFGLSNSAHQLADVAGDAVTPRHELLRKNQELRRENDRLRVLSIQAAENARENARLRLLLGWQQKRPWNLKLANVISRDPANWWNTIQIDLGTRDGLRANLPVLTPDGLVGRVSSVGLTRSQVVLLGDPNCKVSALVENETRDTGVILTGSPLNRTVLILAYLSKDALFKPGQNVVTSGLGGIFPKGIAIGKLLETHPDEDGLYTEARVKLAADLGALEEVWVLFP